MSKKKKQSHFLKRIPLSVRIISSLTLFVIWLIVSLFGVVLFWEWNMEQQALSAAKEEVLSWGLPPDTKLIELNVERANYGTYCIARVHIVIDTEAPREVVEAFYFEDPAHPSSGANRSIRSVESHQGGSVRYEIYLNKGTFFAHD